jgi:hypothetical protein
MQGVVPARTKGHNDFERNKHNFIFAGEQLKAANV